MEYVRLGNSGLKVSKICLGCMTYGDPSRGPHTWALNEEQSRPYYKQALDYGINFFDTANAYSKGASEEVLGRAIKDLAKRDELVIATKVYIPLNENDPNSKGLSRKSIMREIDQSLKRLNTDYVDLYQIHRFDRHTPIEETLEALNDVVKAGKALYIGASSMFAWEFCKMLQVSKQNGWAQFISMQPHYNLIYREEEREMFPLCENEGIGVIPWSPLARGRLARAWQENTTERIQSDKYGKTLYVSMEDSDKKVTDQVGEIAVKRGVSRSQIALSWMFSKPFITSPIIGASKPNHLEEAIQALSIKLTPEEIKALEEPYVPHPVTGIVF